MRRVNQRLQGSTAHYVLSLYDGGNDGHDRNNQKKHKENGLVCRIGIGVRAMAVSEEIDQPVKREPERRDRTIWTDEKTLSGQLVIGQVRREKGNNDGRNKNYPTPQNRIAHVRAVLHRRPPCVQTSQDRMSDGGL